MIQYYSFVSLLRDRRPPCARRTPPRSPPGRRRAARRSAPGRPGGGGLPGSRSAGKVDRARSQLYRCKILQVSTHWKALGEIYEMHFFAPFCTQSKTGKKEPGQNNPEKGENERPLSSSSLPSTSAKGSCEEKLTRMKMEYAYDIWYPFF